jgi:drug/metabolite transporter (DMT)-like permease
VKQPDDAAEGGAAEKIIDTPAPRIETGDGAPYAGAAHDGGQRDAGAKEASPRDASHKDAGPKDAGRKAENIPLGIVCMLASSVVFQISSVLSKWLVETYPIGEMLFMRTVSSLAVAGALILPVTGLGVFRTRRLHDHLFRNISQATAQTFIVVAMSMMPLASVVAITFSAPLFATITAMVVLKESVGPARWGALTIGFLGVLVVASPGRDTFQTGSLFAIANAVLFGTVAVGVRRMASTESTSTLIMHQMVTLTVFFTAFLPFGWVTPTNARDWAALVANGLANVTGQILWTRALHLAPASAVAPFNYFSLVWAVVLGFLVWGDVPATSLFVGSAIVVGSGMFLLWYEARKKRRPGR